MKIKNSHFQKKTEMFVYFPKGSGRGKIRVSSSPKASPGRGKRNGESRKCRKVYGMEQRDLWCTQCKWKKACSRFGE